MRVLAAFVALVFGSILVSEATAQVVQSGSVTTYYIPAASGASIKGNGIDYRNATPMPLPTAQPSAVLQGSSFGRSPSIGSPGNSAGAAGSGELNPFQLVPALTPLQMQQWQGRPSGVRLQDNGTSGLPFTTSRANASYNQTSKYYPFRAAGKLFFTINSIPYTCSASLIKPGVLVTAAHCVTNYGQNQFYSNWQYAPAYNNGLAPYGVWNIKSVSIMTSYYDGTDNCYTYGIICPDDVAVLNISAATGILPGTSTGWYGYGWNGYGFNASSQALITELGYPAAFDAGVFMERNDSQAVSFPSLSNNTLIGSLMTGGSSGGPWLVNLGSPPLLHLVSPGSYPDYNIVVGVTSWAYSGSSIKEQGAAPFTSDNIVVLVNTVCSADSEKC